LFLDWEQAIYTQRENTVPMKRTLLLVLILFLIIFSACGEIKEPTPDIVAVIPPGAANGEDYPAPSDSTIEVAPSTPAEGGSGYPASSVEGDSAKNGYPGPGTDNINGDGSAYPSPLSNPPDAYPAPNNLIDESKRFTMEEPLKDGQQEISGTGVAGISIKVISLSNGGEQLGFGVLTEDGSYTIKLSRPGAGGELLGLQFADDSTAATLEGVPGTDMPMMGLVLAQALVER